jgi:putative SOS response-associated peptidase YedK
MCGRFTDMLTWEELVRLCRLTLDVPAQDTQARYNVCPTTTVDVVLSTDGKRTIAPMLWGSTIQTMDLRVSASAIWGKERTGFMVRWR